MGLPRFRSVAPEQERRDETAMLRANGDQRCARPSEPGAQAVGVVRNRNWPRYHYTPEDDRTFFITEI
ncbi:MAG: hypothetical protein HY052_03830 [Proteobacteria bacterium]|nr:hypothetical protein [Pseudomonadota bacterium]